MNRAEERRPIGITAIWSEGSGIERVSLVAIISHCVRQSYENVRRSPITCVLTVITIAVAIFLLGLFALFVHNTSLAVSKNSGGVEVMVFLKDAASPNDVESLSTKIREIAPGIPVTFTDKPQALAAFRRILADDAAILEGLDVDNPIPASLNVQVSSAEEAERLFQIISEKMSVHPKVESVRYSRGGVQQIKRMLRLIEGVGAIGIAFLFVIAGFIIANTIKLALYNHRIEVEIMQLVGARRSAIFAPYMLEGLIQGFLGASVGVLFVMIVFLITGNFLNQSEILKMIFPSFAFIPTLYIVGVLVAGAGVGVVGSFLAVRRFLAET